jgi:iron complex outermembrane receptor protein
VYLRVLPLLVVALILPWGTSAGAQQDQATQQGQPSANGPQSAQGSALAQPAPRLTTTDTVTVTAPGETRSEQSIDSKLLLEAAPGTSPIQTLARLPSVSVTSADPYGAYEWALRISVRGFNQNQLGFTLDEVPLGDMS